MYNNYGIDSIPTTPIEPNSFESIFGAATGVAVVLLVLLVLIGIALAIFMIVAECKVYEKAGEKWWTAIIPIYNNWILTRITGLGWWWFAILVGLSALTEKLSAVIPMTLFLVYFNYNYNLAKKFGKTNGFAVLLSLLPIIGYPILAFGSAKYNKNAKVDINGIFSIEKK